MAHGSSLVHAFRVFGNPELARTLVTRPARAFQVPAEAVEVFTDGSCNRNGLADAAAGSGVWFGPQDTRNVAVRVPTETETNQTAELYAIELGLKMAHRMGFQQILLYSDSLDALNMLMRDGVYADHPLRDIIGNIRDLLFRDWDVKLFHTSRNNIACADYLAREGHDAPPDADIITIPTVPTGCLHMVLKDQLACRS